MKIIKEQALYFHDFMSNEKESKKKSWIISLPNLKKTVLSLKMKYQIPMSHL